MAYGNPNDPKRFTDDDVRGPTRFDTELQPDPELAEGPASGGKIAMFAVAIALVLGAVFYGLNNSSVQQAGTSSTAQTAQQASPPAAPSGMRDVTPRANTEPGMTTGAAPTANPANPQAATPQGSGNNAPAAASCNRLHHNKPTTN